jgi:hypothetical protein
MFGTRIALQSELDRDCFSDAKNSEILFLVVDLILVYGYQPLRAGFRENGGMPEPVQHGELRARSGWLMLFAIG